MISLGTRRLSVLAVVGALLMLAPAPSIAKRTTSASARRATRSHGRVPDGGHGRRGPSGRRRGRSGHVRRGSRPRSWRARAAIVGGSQISIGQAPWQVAVEAVIPEEKGVATILCGGSILDPAHILTAAHCVFDSKTGKELWVDKLDYQATAVPMTYQGKNGKQYVAIVAAVGGARDATAGKGLFVYALP